MKKNFIKLVKEKVDLCGIEHWEAYITPGSVRQIDKGINDLDALCRHNLNSRFIAKITKHPKTFGNGTCWRIWHDNPRIDRFFEGFDDTVGISLEKVKKIMATVMRRAFENHEFGTFQDGLLLIYM